MSTVPALSRNYCYWKNIDTDIENMVKSCRECCDVRKNPAKAPLHIWETPEKNWQRVHIDYAGPFMEHQFLIVVDSLSKWPEIFAMKTSPTSSNTIYYLEEIFSRHGLPEILVSDNAAIFKSAEFQHFCKSNGIKQRLIAPGYPATNGQAERYVQILKTKLKCMKYHPGSLHSKLCKLLFRYRITPLNNGKTPSEMLFGRNLRCEFDLIKPTK
uniref:Integrase catalytic domain-containing protein n=1 Tax=Parasteatoda tepidariorum TaxID=114398 RepID=A0A2L2YNI8_PARTP